MSPFNCLKRLTFLHYPLNMHPLSQFKYCPKCGSAHFLENNFKSKKCNGCGFIYYFNSCAATVAFIFNDKNELLVATRAHEPAKGTFDLPGGFVDMYETAEEGMIREIKEETGLEVSGISFLFSLPNIYRYSEFDVHTIDMFFLCRVPGTPEITANDDVAKLEFIPLREIDPGKFGLLSVKVGIEKILASELLENNK